MEQFSPDHPRFFSLILNGKRKMNVSKNKTICKSKHFFSLSILVTNIHTVTPSEILERFQKIRGEEIREKGSNTENILEKL